MNSEFRVKPRAKVEEDKIKKAKGLKVKADFEQIQNPKSEIQNRACSACGAKAQRKFAKYCLVCGKSLFEDYQPLDSLRASNRLPKTNFETGELVEKENLFGEESRAANLAWAFVVYSMVPYLGILFFPGAILMSGVSLVIESRKSVPENRKMAIYSVVLSLVIFAIQILLWWLLYVIPELNRS